jgi:hypothetical protein
MTFVRRQIPASWQHPGRGATDALFASIRHTVQGEDHPEIPRVDVFDVMERLAPHIFVLLMVDPGLLVCQAAGRAAQTLLGPDAQGKKFYDLWTEPSQKKLRHYFTISARMHHAFCALSSSRPTVGVPERCTLFIPAFGADGVGKRYIAVTYHTAKRAPDAKPLNTAHLHRITFFLARTANKRENRCLNPLCGHLSQP